MRPAAVCSSETRAEPPRLVRVDRASNPASLAGTFWPTGAAVLARIRAAYSPAKTSLLLCFFLSRGPRPCQAHLLTPSASASRCRRGPKPPSTPLCPHRRPPLLPGQVRPPAAPFAPDRGRAADRQRTSREPSSPFALSPACYLLPPRVPCLDPCRPGLQRAIAGVQAARSHRSILCLEL